MTDMRHMDFLNEVARQDVTCLIQKEATYRGSWKRRGGVGAFMMLARKWDRLESMMEASGHHYDVFFDMGDGSDGSPLAEIRDLRRYLMLVEAELMSRERAPAEPRTVEQQRSPEDGAQHSSLVPWAVSMRWRLNHHMAPDQAEVEVFETWWREVPPGKWVLEPFVDKVEPPPSELWGLYSKNTAGWHVDLDQCPEDLRDQFPYLQVELNHHELQKLPTWQAELYTWVEGPAKYILEDRAWAAEI